MHENQAADFTVGRPIKKLFLFSLPLVAIMILESLYTTADSIVVGRLVGENALSAVSSAGTVYSLFQMIIYGATVGLSVMVSQYYGAGEWKMVKKAIMTSTYAVMALGIVLGAAGALFAPQMLNLVNVPENILDEAVLYLRIVLLGTPVASFYSLADAISRATGDSVTPMIILIISAVLNVGLNLFFVAVLQLAVAGVAYATVLAQGLSAVVCILIVWHRQPAARPDRASLKPDGRVIKQLVRLGVPTTLESSASSMGNIIVSSILNTFGSTVIGAYHSALKIEMLISYAPGGFTGGMQVWAGQNIGAGKPERVRQGYRATAVAILLYSLFSAAVLIFFGRPLVSVFVKDGGEFVDIGAKYLMCASSGLISVGFLYLSRSTLTGAGDAAAALYTTIIEMVFRLGAAYILSHYFGYIGLFFAAPVGFTAGAVFATARYLSGKWKSKAIVEGKNTPAQ